jgi:hypothetical protein
MASTSSRTYVAMYVCNAVTIPLETAMNVGGKFDTKRIHKISTRVVTTYSCFMDVNSYDSLTPPPPKDFSNLSTD